MRNSSTVCIPVSRVEDLPTESRILLPLVQFAQLTHLHIGCPFARSDHGWLQVFSALPQPTSLSFEAQTMTSLSFLSHCAMRTLTLDGTDLPSTEMAHLIRGLPLYTAISMTLHSRAFRNIATLLLRHVTSQPTCHRWLN
jgi:hypothetical protein